MSKNIKKKDNFFVSFFWILIIALIFRAFVFQSYNIPSGSMLKNLLVGDYIFVSKFAYGYSKNSLPFSLPIIPGRVFSSSPKFANHNWPIISSEVRFFSNPCAPVAQKVHCKAQPAWEEMHRVALFFSGILTISIIVPESSLIKYFFVPSGDKYDSSISGGLI